MKYSSILDYLNSKKCKFCKNELMSKHTTFRIGGPADLFIEVPDVCVLQNLLVIMKKGDIPFFLLGNGSNLLINDDGYRGVILKLGEDFTSIKVNGEFIKCGAGVNLSKICKAALENSLTGLEFAYGIPGSCGGAVVMNAGAYGGEMKDVIKSVEFVDQNGKINKISGKDCEFSYRNSLFSKNKYIITFVEFKLSLGNYESIKSRMEDLIARRKLKQPLNFPSAGSFFKSPAGYHASALIEQCGLKGFRIGGAAVSSKHSGFIVNLGNATSDDIKKLQSEIISQIATKTGINLEPEVINLTDNLNS